MENTKDINEILDPLMEKMKLFAQEKPGEEGFMSYLYKVHDVMSCYERFLESSTEEELEYNKKCILAKIALYYG